MKNFDNIIKESIKDSDIVRKMQGNLTLSETALRQSKKVIDFVMKAIDDNKKGKLDDSQLAQLLNSYHQYLKDASISIGKVKKK